jgi:acetyl-CoA acetyltransferase
MVRANQQMKQKAAVVGIGATPYYYRGESDPQTLFELIDKAVLAALDDAGLTVADVDGLALFSYGIEIGFLCEQLGIPEFRFSAVVSGGGGGCAGILDLASMAIETGRAKTVVCIGGTQQGKRRYGQTMNNLDATPDNIFHRLSGLPGPGQTLALSVRRHMHEFGTRREAFGEVVISSRVAAANRETALRRKPLTMDEYMAAPMLADPMCRLDFCLETDGAVAVVVTSAERAVDLPHKPVLIEATAHGGVRDWGRAFFWLNQSAELFTTSGAGPIARRLYESAEIAPSDIDVALLYDHFSPLVVMQLEDYGFCKRGEGGPFVESGAIRLNGSIPVNPHGGQLSEGYIIGMTHIREAVEQLRGTAVNQIAGARTALVTGGPANIPMSGAILRN